MPEGGEWRQIDIGKVPQATKVIPKMAVPKRRWNLDSYACALLVKPEIATLPGRDEKVSHYLPAIRIAAVLLVGGGGIVLPA